MRDTERTDALLGAVDHLYAAALDGSHWGDALRAIDVAFGGAGVTLELKRRRTGELAFFEYADLSREGVEAYGAHYHSVCPRWLALSRSGSGDILRDYDHETETGMRRSEFYEDFLGRHDLRYYVSGTMVNEGDTLGVVAVQFTPSHGHAGEEDVRRMALLVPHVRRSLDIHLRLRDLQHRASGLREMLSRLGVAAILLDGRREVVFANDAACALFDADGPVTIVRRHLQVEDPRERHALLALIAGATIHQGKRAASAGTTHVGRSHPAGSVTITALPLAELPQFETFLNERLEAPAAAIFLTRTGPPSAETVRTIGQIYGLTAAEQQLAAALMAGRSLNEHAALRRISRHTARTHLVNLRSKVGARNQVELVRRLLTALPPGLF